MQRVGRKALVAGEVIIIPLGRGVLCHLGIFSKGGVDVSLLSCDSS